MPGRVATVTCAVSMKSPPWLLFFCCMRWPRSQPSIQDLPCHGSATPQSLLAYSANLVFLRVPLPDYLGNISLNHHQYHLLVISRQGLNCMIPITTSGISSAPRAVSQAAPVPGLAGGSGACGTRPVIALNARENPGEPTDRTCGTQATRRACSPCRPQS